LNSKWQGDSIEATLRKWYMDKETKSFKALPLTIAWGVWIERNKKKIKTRTHYLSSVSHKSLNILRSFPQDLPVHQRAQNIDLIIDTHTPWAFFDGASQGVPPRGGARGGILLTQNHTLSFKASTGPSTNNQSELSTLKLALLLAKEKWLTHLQIMGDSQIVIKWMDGKVKLGNFYYNPFLKM
jgi:hypothetical protein